jgi:hypothetical protein
MPIKIGNVNFRNFVIGLPPPDLSLPASIVAPHQRPPLFFMQGEPKYNLSGFMMSTFYEAFQIVLWLRKTKST